MRRVLLVFIAVLMLCTSAQALELGVQDDGRSSAQVLRDVGMLDGGWTRTIAYVGQPGVAGRIRDAHAAGKKIILTVGGTGTRTRQPTASQLRRYITGLPRADMYGVINEVDLSGMEPCAFRKRWLNVRRLLGSRLGLEFSPHAPLSYTAAMRVCGWLPKRIPILLHPYQRNDPFASPQDAAWKEGGLGNLTHAARALRGMGIRPTWWLDEFGYQPDRGDTAWLWRRAVARARQVHAKVLIAYTAQGPTWDTRFRPAVWCVITDWRDCPLPTAASSDEVPQATGVGTAMVATAEPTPLHDVDGNTATVVEPTPEPTPQPSTEQGASDPAPVPPPSEQDPAPVESP